MTTKRHVLVTGATGQQGGAVAAALLSRGHRVTALTRKPDGEAARRLASAGAAILAGDLGDAASVRQAAQGVDTMYLMGNSYDGGTEEETRQGIIAADAAKAAGIGHLIYSSVGDADRNTGIPHFESKFRVERHIAGLGIPYTVSAPVAFMENAVAPWSIGGLRQGVQAFALPPSVPSSWWPWPISAPSSPPWRSGARQCSAGVSTSPGTSCRARSRRGSCRRPSAARSPIRRSRSPRCGSRARIRR